MRAAARTSTANPPMAMPAIAPPDKVDLLFEVAGAVAAAVVVVLRWIRISFLLKKKKQN